MLPNLPLYYFLRLSSLFFYYFYFDRVNISIMKEERLPPSIFVF